MSYTVKVKKLKENAVVPKRATIGSAGADIYACIDEPVTIEPGSLAMIPTGLAIELESSDCAAFLFARSGLGVKHGITLSNGVGVVDSDYRGEVCIILVNLSSETFVIEDGERIAQMVIARHEQATWQEVEVLDDTERGAGGFGHTGKS